MKLEIRKKIDTSLDMIEMYLYPKNKDDEAIKRLQSIYDSLRKKFDNGEYDENYFSLELVMNNFLVLLENNYITNDLIHKLEGEVYFSQLQLLSGKNQSLDILIDDVYYKKQIENYVMNLNKLNNSEKFSLYDSIKIVMGIRNDYFSDKSGFKSDVLEMEIANAVYQIIVNIIKDSARAKVEVVDFVERLNMDSDLAKMLQHKMGEMILTKGKIMDFEEMQFLMQYVTMKEMINVHDFNIWTRVIKVDKGIVYQEKVEDDSETYEFGGQSVVRIRSKKGQDKQIGLLTKEACFGKSKLEVLKINGLVAPITDYAIATGESVGLRIIANNRYHGRAGWYWTKTILHERVVVIDDTGYIRDSTHEKRTIGIRPIISLDESDLKKLTRDYQAQNGSRSPVYDIQYGHYPQNAASVDMQLILEDAFNHKQIEKTGNFYTSDSKALNAFLTPFLPKKYFEFEFFGKRYIRVQAKFEKEYQILSNGSGYKNGDHIWIEVSPVEWMAIKRDGVMVSKKILAAGVQFYRGTYRLSQLSFERLDVTKFLDKYLLPEMQQIEE